MLSPSRPCAVQLCPALALDDEQFCVAHRTAKKIAQVAEETRCRRGGGVGSLVVVMNLRIGFSCWFQHTDGRILEGTYRAGRKVEVMTAFERTATGFEETTTTFTVPKTIPIHRGPRALLACPARRRLRHARLDADPADSRLLSQGSPPLDAAPEGRDAVVRRAVGAGDERRGRVA